MDMRKLMEAISRHEALSIFADAGVDASSLDAAALKKAHRQLAMQNHPDKGGDMEKMKMINAAFEVLNKTIGAPSGGRSEGPGFRDYETHSSNPYGGGGAQNYSNITYVKTHIEELARATGEKVREYTIWHFDGRFFRGCITVKACPAVFPEMVKAMLEWEDKFYTKKAVFIAEAPQHITLMWLDGKYLANPVTLEYDTFNSNPGNDQQFTRRLPEILEKIAHGGADQLDMFDGDVEGSGTVR